jgi:hypothetical protein
MDVRQLVMADPSLFAGTSEVLLAFPTSMVSIGRLID